MPRSVGTSAPSFSRSKPLATNGSERSSSTHERHTFEDAQSEEHLFEVGVARFEQFVTADREPSRLDQRQVLLRRTHVPPPMVVAVRVRPGAKARGKAASQYPRLCLHSNPGFAQFDTS